MPVPRTRYRYPCTGHNDAEGFAEFLKSELGSSRRNIVALIDELSHTFAIPRPTSRFRKPMWPTSRAFWPRNSQDERRIRTACAGLRACASATARVHPAISTGARLFPRTLSAHAGVGAAG